jgi:anti-sigma regulatory factor (Ser/Thr protein kinase)
MAAPANYFAQTPGRPAGDPVLRARDERLESLKAVVGKLAHDFNNFLVPQFGYITLLAEDLAGQESAAQYLATMNHAARTTESYIESVLLAMRPQRQFSPKLLELGAMLNGATDQWAAALPPGLGLEIKREIEAGPFHGDERHWTKVFEHLLSNARHALASGGVLEVSLKQASLSDGEAERLGLESGDVYQLRFADNGFGMAPDQLTRAFDPFFTTRGQTRGSGLGLTIVHTIAHFYGGQVELRSAEDQGATITLWWPRQAPAMARAGTTGLLRRPARKKKVLLLEPDPALREALRGLLSAEELDVQGCEGAAEAGKCLKRDAKAIALFVGEAVLPEGPALELLAPELASIPAILIASKDEPAERPTAPNVLFLEKPLSLRQVRSLVRSAIAKGGGDTGPA